MPRDGTELRKREMRYPVRLGAYARRKGEDVVRVEISQMSYGGCQLVSRLAFAVGDHLILTVPRMGEITGEVRWTAADRIGVAFDLQERVADLGCESIARLKRY